MTKAEFLNEIDEMTEVEPGTSTMEDELDSKEGWNSLAVISFIAMADEKLNLSLDVSMLTNCKTVGDLAELCKSKLD